MKNAYIKVSLILPKDKPINTVRNFPVLGSFKAKKVEIFVRPSKNEKYHIVDVFILQ